MAQRKGKQDYGEYYPIIINCTVEVRDQFRKDLKLDRKRGLKIERDRFSF